MTEDMWKRCIDMLMRHEGYRRFPYRDTMGILTVGYGRNLQENGISPAEAEFLLDSDIRKCESQCMASFPFWNELTERRQLVLINMCFNLGIRGLLGFKKMIAALQAQDYLEARDQMLNSKWALQVGRRAEELANMFMEND